MEKKKKEIVKKLLNQNLEEKDEEEILDITAVLWLAILLIFSFLGCY